MKISLCKYNHTNGISDQIWFMKEIFKQNNYEIEVKDYLDPLALNIMVENFIDIDGPAIDFFCKKWNKTVAIMPTEHLSLKNGVALFNGTKFSDRTYINNKAERYYSLARNSGNLAFFLIAGELPAASGLRQVFRQHSFYHLPYPVIEAGYSGTQPEYDFVFTGFQTSYRKRQIKRLTRDHSVLAGRISGDQTRAEIYGRAALALNIPQTAGWQWVSPMRIQYGLARGKGTLHLGSRDESRFAREVCEDISPAEAVRDPEAFFHRQLERYNSLAIGKNASAVFPHKAFELWAMRENIRIQSAPRPA